MSDIQKEIKEVLEKATQGPWLMNDMDTAYSNEVFANPSGHAYVKVAGGLKIEDAHLIANAPTWLLHQQELIEQKDAEIARLQQALISERDEALKWDGIGTVSRINKVLKGADTCAP